MMIKLFNKVGGMLGEDTLRGDGSNNNGKLTHQQIDNEVAQIQANPAFMDRSSPMNKVLIQRFEDLFKMRSG